MKHQDVQVYYAIKSVFHYQLIKLAVYSQDTKEAAQGTKS